MGGCIRQHTKKDLSAQVWKLWSFPTVPKPGNEPSFQAWKLALSAIACTCGYSFSSLGTAILARLGLLHLGCNREMVALLRWLLTQVSL